MMNRNSFGLPITAAFQEMIRQRRQTPCFLCHRRLSDDVLVWPVYPEYDEIVGTPPGSLGMISVGLCKPFIDQRDGAAWAMNHILRLLAERAAEKGLPMPLTPPTPIIKIPTDFDR